MSDMDVILNILHQHDKYADLVHPFLETVDAARRVANARPMYQQGGHWYLMDADDMNKPDGWLLSITEDG